MPGGRLLPKGRRGSVECGGVGRAGGWFLPSGGSSGSGRFPLVGVFLGGCPTLREPGGSRWIPGRVLLMLFLELLTLLLPPLVGVRVPGKLPDGGRLPAAGGFPGLG